MDALTLLRDQVDTAERLLQQTTEGLTLSQALWRLPGSTANPIFSIYLHVYVTEDRIIHRERAQPPLLESQGWRERLGFDPAAPWAVPEHPDLDACRAYARAVHAVTRAYLAALTPSALDEEIETPRGRRPRVASLSLMLVTHKLTHLGEIAALLGCQGAKGFPF